jgi:hypothetical protein
MYSAKTKIFLKLSLINPAVPLLSDKLLSADVNAAILAELSTPLDNLTMAV